MGQWGKMGHFKKIVCMTTTLNIFKNNWSLQLPNNYSSHIPEDGRCCCSCSSCSAAFVRFKKILTPRMLQKLRSHTKMRYQTKLVYLWLFTFYRPKLGIMVFHKKNRFFLHYIDFLTVGLNGSLNHLFIFSKLLMICSDFNCLRCLGTQNCPLPLQHMNIKHFWGP
jgi:hypothetical protein